MNETTTDRAQAVIDATLRLLGDLAFEDVTLQRIADGAGLSLAELAATFATRHAILDAFYRRIDQEVLAADRSDMADEAPRERLFDVLMSRIDALRPYRSGLRGLMRSARRDPALALSLNALAVRSQGWMLAAAAIDTRGWRGRLVRQALAVGFARVLHTFVAEDDTGLPRTMAALDRALNEAQRRHRRFARLLGDAVVGAPAATGEHAPAGDAPASPAPPPATGGAAPPAAPEAGGTPAASPFGTPAQDAAPPPVAPGTNRAKASAVHPRDDEEPT